MSKVQAQTVKKIHADIKERGLLMLADAELPSVVGLITGESLKGSWWGHPLGNLIFNSSSDVEDLNDVLTLKLLKGKVTFVHEDLWQPLLTVLMSRDEWQMKKLPKATHDLLAHVDEVGRALSQDVVKSVKAAAKDIAVLEKRGLLLTQQVHTETGAHAKYLVSWAKWASENKVKASKSAKAKIEAYQIIEASVRKFDPTAKCLPWV